MTTGSIIVGGSLDLVESNADVAPAGVTRLRRKSGVLQQSTDGSAFGGLSGDAGLISTAGAAVQDLTVSGLLGDTDGGYEIEGNIVTTAATPNYLLYINGATIAAGGGAGGNVNVTGTNFPLPLKTDLYVGSNATANISNLAFRIRMGSKSGVLQAFSCLSFSLRSGGVNFASYYVTGQFTPGAQITSISIHSDAAGTIDIGSYVRVRRLGFLA